MKQSKGDIKNLTLALELFHKMSLVTSPPVGGSTIPYLSPKGTLLVT